MVKTLPNLASTFFLSSSLLVLFLARSPWVATNTTKAGLWDLEREDYNDDQNSEKASDNGCADHEYDENDYENDNENDNENDDESSETFRSLPAAPLGGSLTGGRKARTSPLIRSLLI